MSISAHISQRYCAEYTCNSISPEAWYHPLSYIKARSYYPPVLTLQVAVLAVVAKVISSDLSRPIRSSCLQPDRINNYRCFKCCHSDGNMLIYSNNGHSVFINRLLSISKKSGTSQSVSHSV